jgi:hypothetical protein
MNPRRIFIESFDQGLSAGLLMFGKVQRPGSSSAELAAATTPEMLAAYAEVSPSLPALLLDLKEKVRKLDANYALLTRVCGWVWWLAWLSAFVYLGMNGHAKEALVFLVLPLLVLIRILIRAISC